MSNQMKFRKRKCALFIPIIVMITSIFSVGFSADFNDDVVTNSLTNAMIEASGRNNDILRYFFDSFDLEKLILTGESATIGYIIHSFKSSHGDLMPVNNKYAPFNGGFAVWKGNLFVEGYYRQNLAKNPKNPKNLTNQLINSQPWFEFNKSQKSGEMKTTGVEEKMLSLLGKGKHSLYRGTSIDEWNEIDRYKKASRLDEKEEILEKFFKRVK